MPQQRCRTPAPEPGARPRPRYRSLSGAVTDSVTGAPLQGVVVDVYDANDAFVIATTTGADGQYSVSGLADGTYEVGFDGSSAGYQPQFYAQEASLDSADPVDVTAGTTTTDIDAALDPGVGISGRVTDVSTGAGVGGVQVTVFDEVNGGSVGTATTAGDGSYSLSGLPPGTYAVQFQAASGNYLPEFYDGEWSQNTADQLTPRPRPQRDGNRRRAEPGRHAIGHRDRCGQRHGAEWRKRHGV